MYLQGMVKQIPNIITLFNLLCGCIATLYLFQGQFLFAVMFIGIGLVADFVDGLAARLLDAQSDLGKELDSLADMVTFGFCPGLILYILLALYFQDGQFPEQIIWQATPGFLVTLFAAFRLAKFNLDGRQTTTFIGLSTPACTILIAGLLIIYDQNTLGLSGMIQQPVFLYPLIIGLSYLLISEIPMFSFKFKQLTWAGNEIKVIFAAIAILLLIFLREVGLVGAIILYILINLYLYWVKKFAN